MPYDVRLPNGYVITDVPEDVDKEAFRKQVLKQFPDIAAKEKRTWGEALTDVGASLATGVGQLAQVPGQLAELVGISAPETLKGMPLPGPAGAVTGLQGIGRRLETFGEEAKSPILKGKETIRAQKIAQAEGVIPEFTTAIKETVKDPALLSSFFTEQIPNLFGSFGGGMLARGATKALMSDTIKASLGKAGAEKVLGKAGVSGAVGTGAVMQGADIGADTYETIYSQLRERGTPDEEAQGIALAKARVAALEAAGLSIGTAFLPGGSTIERALVGKGLPRTGGFTKGLIGEAISEGIEEGGGAFAKQVGVQEVFPETNLLKGVGAAAGFGALGGALFGGPAGAINTRTVKEAQTIAAETNEPQQVTLQLPYDEKVKAPTTFGTVPMIVYPDGTTAFQSEAGPVPTTELSEEEFAKKFAPQPIPNVIGQKDLDALGLSKAKGIAFDKLKKSILDRDISDPVQAKEVKEAIEAYGQRKTVSNKVTPKLEAFLERPEFQEPAKVEETIAPIAEPKKRAKKTKEVLEEAIPTEEQAALQEELLAELEQPETQYVGERNEPIAGAGEPSVPVPSERGEPAPGVAETGQAGLAGIVSPIRQPLRGEKPVKSALGITPLTLEEKAAQLIAQRTAPQKAYNPDIQEPSVKLNPRQIKEYREAIGNYLERGNYFGAKALDNLAGDLYSKENTTEANRAYRGLAEDQKDYIAKRTKQFKDEERRGGNWKKAFDIRQKAEKAFKETLDEGELPLAPQDIVRKKPEKTVKEAPVKEETAGPITGTKLQQNKEFARRMGYVPTVGGHRLKGAVNKKALAAAEAGDTKGLLDALGKSKNPIYRQIASVARNVKGLKVAVDSTKIEKKFSQLKETIDSAKITIANIDALREAKRRVDAGERIQDVANSIIQFPKGLTPQVKRDITLASDLYAKNAFLSKEEFYKYVAEQEAMLEGYEESNRYAAGTPVEVEAIPGLYDPKTNTIYLDPYHGKYEDVIAHELAHAISYDFIASPKAKTNPTYKALDKLYKHVLTKFSDKDAYGLSSLDEFVSEGLSNPIFQKELAEIKYENTTAWGKFVQSIAKILGLRPNNALTELLNLTFIAAEQGQSTVRTGEGSFLISPAAKISKYDNIEANAGYAGKRPEKTQPFQIRKVTPAEAKQGLNKFLNKTETMWFSSDAALANRIREELEASGTNWETIKEQMFKISTSQATHSEAVAMKFLEQGNVVYDNEAFKWAAKDDKNNWKSLIQDISALASKYGVSSEKMSDYAHQAFVAERLEGLSKSKKDFYSHKSPEQIKAGLEWFKEFPELKELRNKWNAIRKNAMDVAVQSGLYNEAQAEELLDAMDYVPFYRVEQLEAKAGPKEFGRGLLDFAKNYKIRGSEDEVSNVFDNMERWISYTVSRSVKNKTALNMYDIAKQLMPDEVKDIRQDERIKRDQNVVDLWIDGVKRRVEFKDPMFIYAFQGMEPVVLPSLRLWASAANILRKNIVLIPFFSVSQLSQDSFAAMLSSGLKRPFKLPLEVAKEFTKTLMGTSEAAAALNKYGAVGIKDYSAVVARNEAEIAAGLKKPSTWQKVLSPLERIAMASDNAVRQAVYNLTLEEGGDKATAIERAFEIINFKRSGASGNVQILRQVIPFFGAYLQAQNVVYKTLMGKSISPSQKKEAQRILLSNAAKIAALGFIYTALVSDDEDYQKMDPTIRDRHLIIPGTGFMLPLRTDIFLFPKLTSEYAYQYLTDAGYTDGKKMRRGMADAVANAILSPTVAPQVAKPALEVLANYNTFTGRPIIGQGLENLPTAQQYSNYTSELAKILGKAGVIAPVNIDHLIRGYFGTTGGLGLAATSWAINGGKDIPAPEKTMQDALATFPGLSAFFYREYGSAAKNDFYELRTEVDKAMNGFNRMKKRGQVEEAKEFMEEKKDLLAVRSQVNNINNQLAKIRARENEIYELPASKMSAEQKGAEIKKLRELEKRALERVYDLRQRAGF